jgi:hypothetical protein
MLDKNRSGGHLDVFIDRWRWTSNPTNGIVEICEMCEMCGGGGRALRDKIMTKRNVYRQAKGRYALLRYAIATILLCCHDPLKIYSNWASLEGVHASRPQLGNI